MKKLFIILIITLVILLAVRALLSKPPATQSASTPTPAPTIIQEESGAVKLIKNISAKEDLLDMTVSPDEKRLFITSFDENKIYVIDTETNEITDEINTSAGPYGIAYLDTSNKLAVSGGSNQVLILEAETGAELASIEVGLKPLDLAKSLDGQYLFVANSMDDTISIVNASTNQVVKTIQVGRSPERLFLSPNGQWLFVNNRASDNISVISTQSLTLTSTITVAGNPTTLVPSNQNNAVYLLDSWTNELITLDAQNYSEIERLGVDELPVDAVLSPSQERLYVLSFAKNSLSVINLKKKTIENRLSFSQGFLPETGLNRLQLLPKSQKLYITNTNFGKVLVVSLE